MTQEARLHGGGVVVLRHGNDGAPHVPGAPELTRLPIALPAAVPRRQIPTMPSALSAAVPRRVAIVAGVRTPFARAGTVLRDLSAIELGKLAVRELVFRTGIEPASVELIAFGTVVPSVLAPNIAREIALMPLFPKSVQAWTVGRACASANQAITDAADQIALGHADVAIAGGAESLSAVPILHSRRFSDMLVAASKAKTLGARLRAFSGLRPRDLVPITPA